MNINHFLFLAVAFNISFSCATEAKSVQIGFWESAGVRKAFHLTDGQWISSLKSVNNANELDKAAELYKAPTQWTMYFDGKTYGNLTTTAFKKYDFYIQNGLQKVTSEQPEPSFRKTDKKFTSIDGTSVRPILVSNTSDLKDPDMWKPDTQIKKIPRTILSDLKSRLKNKIFYCKQESCEDESEKYRLQQNDLMLATAYKNNKNETLLKIQFQFSPKSYVYCETEGDNCWGQSFWYLVSNKDQVQFLTNAQSLIDSADVDLDGVSELFFWISGDNLNGYELVDGKTKKSKKSTWFAH